MVYGLETVAITKKQVGQMEVTEMKMLRFAMGDTRKDEIRNEYIRGTVKIERLGIKVRKGRLRWYGHVIKRDQEYVGRRMMEMELLDKRKRGRSKRNFLDVLKEDMGKIDARRKDIGNRILWRNIIRCGNLLLKKKAKRRKTLNYYEELLQTQTDNLWGIYCATFNHVF